MFPYIISFFLMFIIFAGGVYWFVKRKYDDFLIKNDERVKEIKEKSQQEYESAILKSKEAATEFLLQEREKLREEQQVAEEELHDYELQLEKESQRINTLKKENSERDAQINSRYLKLKEHYEEIKNIKRQKRELLGKELEEIEKVARISSEDLKLQIKNKMISVAAKEAKAVVMSYEDIPEADFIPQAKRIIGISIGRLKHTKIQEKHFSSIILKPEQMERLQDIAGGELKNIEEIFGLPFLISENDENKEISIRFDSIDAVNKEIARRVIEKLPSSLKTLDELRAFWDKKSSEMDSELIGFGRKAFKVAGLRPDVDPEIIKLLGRLYYRTSYTQNQWLHSVEASQLAGLMAYELGLDVKLAKKAALLHDIGKALTHEKEGSHAVIGANEARKYGIDEIVVNAMESHHGDVPIKSLYSRLVMAADALSGGRPGARRELMETYFDRIKNLEKLVTKFDGVYEVQAVQAGRELRIVVDNSVINDEKTEDLAEKIAKKVSDELVFPGQIKVTVIRNFKAIEYAK